MLITNQTTDDYWFGPLHLQGGVGQTLTVDDTSETSLYLTDDSVADAINGLYASGRIDVSGAASTFPRSMDCPAILYGDGAPEGSVFAAEASVYLRRDGNEPNSALVYVKSTDCEVNTGWLAHGLWHNVDDPDEPAFQNSWANAGGGLAPLRFRRTLDGSVEIQGSVTGGAPGTVIFTLPEEFRPDFELHQPGSDDTGAFMVIVVKANGDVQGGF